MEGQAIWDKLINALRKPEEIQTTTGLWFEASSSDSRLYVDKAVDHAPSCELFMQTSISKRDFLFVHSYYERWANGENGIRQEVSRKSRNTAYIFALISKYVV